MLDRDVRLLRVLRKSVHGKDKYYLQLSVSGAPAVKRDADGSILHPIGDGTVGIYIDTRALTVAYFDADPEAHSDSDDSSSEGVISYKKYDLDFNTGCDEEITRLNHYMMRSRRRSNPEYFDSEGNIKPEYTDTNRKLSWQYSHSYIKARDRVADLKRIKGERTRIRSGAIANEILSYGSRITVNDYSFRGAVRRGRSGGHPGRQSDVMPETPSRELRKAGRVIEHNAPAQILELIDKKLAARGLDPMKRVHLEVDHSIPDFREHYARQLLIL